MKNFKDCVHFKNTSLKDYCTFKIGGYAKHLFVVYSSNALIEVCRFLQQKNINFKVIGLGANLLFSDRGYDGAIIVNQSASIMFRKNTVYVGSGTNFGELIFCCRKKGLSGIECLAGIPSTVGGALVNNLGAFNTTFENCVEWIEGFYLSNLNKKIRLHKNDCCFGYRTSIFKQGNFIITKAKLRLNYDNPLNISLKIRQCLTAKHQSQPVNLPSAGSIFKRCEIIPAKVIDELGLKGLTVGGAQISTKHAGFIVNTNNASASNVRSLISTIKAKVKAATNVNLPLELEILPYKNKILKPKIIDL